MLKMLCFVLFFPIIMASGQCALPQCLCEVEMIKGLNNGAEIVIEEKESAEINKILSEIFEGAREMPAYGVSLHNETIKAMQSGVWLEFVFDETREQSELPYDSLLFEVQPNSTGVNLIRGVNGQYDGRCLYFDLDNNFQKLYDYLLTLPTKEVKEEEETQEGKATEASEITENSGNSEVTPEEKPKKKVI